MAIPVTETPPSLERQAEIISKANYLELEKARQHALGEMQSLTQGKNRIPSGYAIWSFFVGKIETEQRRRARESLVSWRSIACASPGFGRFYSGRIVG